MSTQTANPLAIFDKALGEKDLDTAYDAAALVKRRGQHLTLDRILRLTLRSGEAWDRRYHAAARRLLVLVLVELEPPMLQAKKLADALAHLNHPDYATAAREGLWDCVDQLRRRELVEVNFDSLEGETSISTEPRPTSMDLFKPLAERTHEGECILCGAHVHYMERPTQEHLDSAHPGWQGPSRG